MTAKRNDGHTHLAGPPEGRAGAAAGCAPTSRACVLEPAALTRHNDA